MRKPPIAPSVRSRMNASPTTKSSSRKSNLSKMSSDFRKTARYPKVPSLNLGPNNRKLAPPARMARKKREQPLTVPDLTSPRRRKSLADAVMSQPPSRRLKPSDFPPMEGIRKLLAALPAAQAMVRRPFLAQKLAAFH